MSKPNRKKKEGLGYRIYTRPGPAGTHLFYGDFRRLGGQRIALKPEGDTRATIDPEAAKVFAAAEATRLIVAKGHTARVGAGIEKPKDIRPRFKAACVEHLLLKERAKGDKRVSDRHLGETEAMLRRAADYFGNDRVLDTITPSNVRAWLDSLGQSRKGLRGNETLSGGRLRGYLNALSNLYRRAQERGYVLPGFNPAGAIMEKPSGNAEEARWLEAHEAALLLESARTWTPPDIAEYWRQKATGKEDVPEPRSIPFMHALLATFCLTGGRKQEVLGLTVADVSFERKRITFRPHTHRRLKTKTSERVVPLWPQLEEVLRAHMKEQAIAGGLLFPSPAGGGMIVDVRKPLDTIGERAGWAHGELRTKMFRHTYCSARLQTLDRGAPVALYTVARELGHGGLTLVNKVYGHVSDSPHRADRVEFVLEAIDRVEDPTKRTVLRSRLNALRAVKTVA